MTASEQAGEVPPAGEAFSGPAGGRAQRGERSTAAWEGHAALLGVPNSGARSKPRGGNQRELARQKNLKKTQEIHKGKRKEDNLSASQRKQRDSEIMQQKQKAANERKSLQTGAK
ncbi:small EDRK-rich factor 1 isoform 1-T1 [Porphyrio hochstetteri]